MANKELINEVFMSCRLVLARAVSRLVPPHEIEDIVQETYVRVCQFRAKNEVREPRALMLKVARNLALDHIKRAEWRLNSSLEGREEFGSASEEPFTQAASDEEFAHFCKAVRQLPQQCRRVFVLKKVYGMSQREIARELQISESTVEKHIGKGMKFCANYMLQHTEKDNSRYTGVEKVAVSQGGKQ